MSSRKPPAPAGVPSPRGLADTYTPFLEQQLARLRVAEADVPDLAQEVLCVAVGALASFVPRAGLSLDAALRLWLYRICVHKAATYRKQAARRAELSFDELGGWEGPASDAASPEAVVRGHEEMSLFLELVETLAPERRAVFVAYVAEDRPMCEIAAELGLVEATAWTRYYQALDDLRAAYQRRTARERRYLAVLWASVVELSPPADGAPASGGAHASGGAPASGGAHASGGAPVSGGARPRAQGRAAAARWERAGVRAALLVAAVVLCFDVVLQGAAGLGGSFVSGAQEPGVAHPGAGREWNHVLLWQPPGTLADARGSEGRGSLADARGSEAHGAGALADARGSEGRGSPADARGAEGTFPSREREGAEPGRFGAPADARGSEGRGARFAEERREERAFLAKAREAMAAGKTADACAALDMYRRRFPRPVLADVRALLEARLGDACRLLRREGAPRGRPRAGRSHPRPARRVARSGRASPGCASRSGRSRPRPRLPGKGNPCSIPDLLGKPHARRTSTERCMSRKKDHFVEVVMNGHRYVATEEAGKIFLKRDGDSIGKALWENDQMVNCTTTALPDDAFLALERKLRERFNANWDED